MTTTGGGSRTPLAGRARRVTFGAAVGGGVTCLVALLAQAVGRAIMALWPAPDANIGLGLAMLAVPAVAIPLAVWLGLRRLGIPAAGVVAAGTVVAYLAAFFVPFVDRSPPWVVVAQVVLVAGYTGAAVWAACLFADRR